MNTNPLILGFFAKYIEEQIGIIYSETNWFQLEHRLGDIVTLLGFSNLEELWKKAQTGIYGEMRDLLLDLATNNETSFFRDSSLFDAIVRDIVPEMKARNPRLSTVRFWSAAGSTGQEACSVAMSMEQARLKDALFPDYDIFVTDISDRVLKRAREGCYSQLEVQRGLPTRFLLEYFEKEGESTWKIKSKITQKFTFKKINLLEPFPSEVGVYDIILCRNVLIYQSLENKASVVNKLLKCLSPQGYLVLGAAESMLGVSTHFKQIHFGTAVVYQKLA